MYSPSGVPGAGARFSASRASVATASGVQTENGG